MFWWPLVLVGIFQTFQLGRQQLREGTPPSAFALLIWAFVSWAVVAVYIPLAWDRYLLPIQAPNALLVAVGGVEALAAMAREGGARVRRKLIPAAGVFLILLGSDAFFWHSRDWNTASRLMLTYAMVDRGTVVITGLDQQTGDKAFYRGEYYSDKLPGLSLAGGGAVRLCEGGVPASAPSPQCAPEEVLAGRLLDHTGHVEPPDCLDGGVAGAPGPRAGLRARRGHAGGPGVWPFDARVCLRDAGVRPPGVGLCAVRFVPADPEGIVAFRGYADSPLRVSWRRRRRSSSYKWRRYRRSWASIS